MKKIAISGKMASGKTSVSDYLIKEYGYERYSIAEKVKAFASAYALHNVFVNMQSSQNLAWSSMIEILEELDTDNKFEDKTALLNTILNVILKDFDDVTNTFNKTDKVRGLLQTIGNEFRNLMGEDIWVNETINRLDSELCVIDDIRYKNEFNALRAAGFCIIRLEVGSAMQRERLDFLYGSIPQEKLEHISEIDLDGMSFDYVINSSQNLETVIERLKYILEENRC